MIQTVWLKNNIVRSLSTADNILFFAHKNVLDFLGIAGYKIFLFEPDGSLGIAVHCTADVSCDVTDGFVMPPECCFSCLKTAEANSVINIEAGCLIPLKADDTSVFGALLISEDNFREIPENGWKLIRAFANLLYSEAMGGFLRSFFPEVLRVRNLEMEYQKGVKIIKGIDLDICENEFTVILGSSGCGKTTMVNAIGGMLKPTGGEVLWNGKNIAVMNDKERTAYRRDAVGFIFQHYNLISDLSAKENVNVAASLVNNPMPVEDALTMVGLADKAGNYPGKMSGGEQQRVCIARAIAKRPQILLCDEPTGALDPENSIRVMKILQDLVKEQHIAVVMITHNTAFRCLADHCIVMSAGCIVEDIRQPFPRYADSLQLR